MSNKRYKKIKISKLAVFNIYGNQNVSELFENVDIINDDINKLKYNVSERLPIDLHRLESKIENKISDIYKELKHVNTTSPNEVVEVNVNKDIVKLNRKIESIDSRVNTLEETKTIPKESGNVFSDYEEEIRNCKKYIKQLVDFCQTQKTEIIQQDQKIKSLENTICNQNNVINGQERKIEGLKEKISEQDKFFENLVQRIKALEGQSKLSSNVGKAESVKAESESADFVFPVLKNNINLVCIDEDSDDSAINEYLGKVTDISEIESFLNKGTLEKSYQNTYLKIFAKYKKDLINEIKKADISDLDDDEKSEAIISIVGNAVKNTITGKVIPVICDRIANNYNEYKEFFEIINKYLSSIGFYNEKINVGDLITDGNNSINMETSYIKTTNPKEHGKISEIKTLPYMINYIDEDGNKASFVCKGSCSAYRFG